ncbi:diadenylate cyclase CdaA [Halobacteriovorax sp. HLS]|uniref:diadenylate cyclase CdaA n=1 Tax=Halobacteriovorax sp. HLS TaxID=2234000 RepID=UPI000FDC2752|nr:diadenylate cyclase CdaA [Halobacteriovorax sp. HLS]
MSFLEVLYQQMGIKDVVDIGVVSIILYQILRIVQGTRALQILLGLVLVLCLWGIGLYYKLYSLNWILTHFFEYFVLIFIILFQDQLRSALASVATGRRVFFGVFSRKRDTLEIEEIVEATSVLSKEKIGALIVFERDHGLENIINTGTRLNSEIHSDLIYSIFQSSSPLHDGAILIQGSKIAAAGCFLPLSNNVEIDRHLGTRHRAALGISEISDAIVVTVSEENGKMNVCVDGSFYLCSNENQLRQYLKHLWSNEKLDKNLKPIQQRVVE